MSSGKILIGALAGLATGLTLGILFAPDKGSKTRKKISSKTEDMAGDLKDKFNQFVEGVTNQFSTAKEKASDMADKGKAKADEVRNKTASATN